MRSSLAIVLGLLAVSLLSSPRVIAGGESPQFGAVSIHRDSSGTRAPAFSIGADGVFHARHVSTLDLIRLAWREHSPITPRARVSAAPAWLDTDRFNIEAVTPATTDDALATGLRRMLEERFGVAAEIESHSTTAYVLVPAGKGVRLGKHLNPATVSCVDPDPFRSIFNPLRRCSTRFGAPEIRDPEPAYRMMLADVTMDHLAWALESMFRGELTLYTDTPWAPPSSRRQNTRTFLDSELVVNETGLAGRYDVNLEFTVIPPISTSNFTSSNQVSGPGADGHPPGSVSLFRALEEQAGLKLESRRMPVDFLRIDAASFPVLN